MLQQASHVGLEPLHCRRVAIVIVAANLPLPIDQNKPRAVHDYAVIAVRRCCYGETKPVFD